MADQTTTVPGVGKVPKKELTIGLVVVGTLIVVYYVRSKSASSTPAAAATTTNQYPPDGTTGNPSDLYSTDPATGQTYGDEAAGSGGTYGAYGTGAASGLYYDPSTGAYDLTSPYGSPTTTATQVTNGPPFSTNAAWSQYVVATMEANNPSQDPGALTDALGLYLSGQPVDTSQQQLIFDATAIAGNPPVAGPNNYPPNVQLNGNKGGGSGGTPAPPPAPTGPQQISVTGQTLEYGLPALEAAGWTINSVRVGGQLYAQAGYPATQKTAVITGTQFYPGAGVTGQHFSNSVDVTA